MHRNYKNAGWRSRQTYFKKQQKAQQTKKRILRTVILLPAFCIVVYAAVIGIINLYEKFSSASTPHSVTVTTENGKQSDEKPASSEALESKPVSQPEAADTENKKSPEESKNSGQQPVQGVQITPGYVKKDLSRIIGRPEMSSFMSPDFESTYAGSKIRVHTTIDANLQGFLSESVQNVNELKHGKPRYFSIVAMEPETGKILGMGGFDGDEGKKGVFLGNLYPSASVFKIITAAAAVESKGFTPGTVLLFHGNKYTLYKSQINDGRDRYATKITLNDSFAQSVNPVFGKIGCNYLNKEILYSYATAFGFNKKFDFELPLEQSFLEIPDDKFQQAEIASGYNRNTKISAVHGAMIASAVVNDGKLPEPYLVQKVTDDKGGILYQAAPKPGEQAITPDTAAILRQLMGSTVSKGTGKKSFAGFEKDIVLKNLEMGGKTGSIDNSTHEVRFDWFIGFAKGDNGKNVAVAIVVGHEKYIGTKAGRYARMIFRRYFQAGSPQEKKV